MQSLIKTCALPIVLLSLTACGGGGGGSKPAPSSAASSVAPSSTPASSAAASSVAAANETTQAAVNYTGYSVAQIDNCGVGITAPAADKGFVVLGDYDAGAQNQTLLNFSGWNHTTNGSATEWKNLKLAGSNYDFSSSGKVNSGCNSVDTLDIVLVKKIADWDHQHSNGFERNILPFALMFGDIENVVLDLKINSAKTSLPSLDSLKTTYASNVSSETIDGLESSKVNIGMVIYDGKEEPILDAKRIIQLDQSTLADKWIRVTIPMKDLTFCSNSNYNCTPKTLADLSNKLIAGIQFVGETKTGLVLRNHIKEADWNIANPPPETFKEMDVSFKKIEFQLKSK